MNWLITLKKAAISLGVLLLTILATILSTNPGLLNNLLGEWGKLTIAGVVMMGLTALLDYLKHRNDDPNKPVR